jgi:DNA repair exonuclease SbcCD ATPase subunit
MEPVFRPFIPAIRKKPGTAGLSAKEIRERKRKRLERERHNNDATHPLVIVTPPTLLSGEKEIHHSTTALQPDIVVSPVVALEQHQHQHRSQNCEKIGQDRLQSRPDEETQLLQDLQIQIQSLEKQERNVSQDRLQAQIQELEAKRAELSKALEMERAALQLEEKKYLELETDLAGFYQTLNHIQSRREAIQQATEKTRNESIQLQTTVQEIREETLQLEKTQNECAHELETQKKALESERIIFASTMKKTCLNISRLREAIERLTECNQREAAARASTLAVAKQTLRAGKHKLNALLSDPPTEPDLKTVYWCPNPRKKEKTKKSIRSSRHASAPEENAAASLSIVQNNEKDVKDFESELLDREQDHATPVQQRRRIAEGDSLSRLGDTRSVNSQKLSSGEKKKKYGGLRKQIFKDTTDSLAASSESASPPSLTYMSHEIMRKRKRKNQYATI